MYASCMYKVTAFIGFIQPVLYAGFCPLNSNMWTKKLFHQLIQGGKLCIILAKLEHRISSSLPKVNINK